MTTPSTLKIEATIPGAHLDADGRRRDPGNGQPDPVDLLDRIANLEAQVKAGASELESACARADEAARAKGDFLANMSHEIRTPMNAIIGMSQLALKLDLDGKARNYVTKINRAAESLLGILNDILDYSKIEAGKLDLEAIVFSLDDVMEHLATLIGFKAAERGLELHFDLAGDLPEGLIGDPLRLGQVLINLGNNAVKFTERGDIVVGVRAVSSNADQAELHFWVKDSGIGMTAEQCGRLFKSFSQVEASTSRKYGGTGLGLAISKNLVEAMAGRIWVESAAGLGSTFHFNARFGVPDRAVAGRRMPLAAELAGVRVLVVDDNSLARDILDQLCRQFGLSVEVAIDGFDALALARQADQSGRPFRLALVDWKMPIMDGIDCLATMAREFGPRAPEGILLSPYGQDDMHSLAEQRGLSLAAVLNKPVTASTLLETLGRALGTQKPPAESASAPVTVPEQWRNLRGSRLLLVEDNELNQELARELLREAGIAIIIAEHGQAALDRLARDAAFDGILMDCQMPVMDGYEASRIIRANPAWRHVPIIAMTANAMSTDRDKVLAAGMDDYITKPIDPGAAFATLARWIRPESGPANGASDGAPARREDGLPILPGLDVDTGLGYCGQRVELYRKLLLRYRQQCASFAPDFDAALLAGDMITAGRLAHTLKGTSGTLGATALASLCLELEAACGNRDAANAGERMNGLRPLLDEMTAGLAVLETPLS